MNPTKQTVLHDPANGLHGNCLSAVAGVTGLATAMMVFSGVA